MAWTKAKTAIVVGAGLLLAAGTAAVWQVAIANGDEGLEAMRTAPPQVTIVRSKYTTDGHGSLMDVGEHGLPRSPNDQWRYIGMHSTPSEIIERAYWNGNLLLPPRIIFPSDMPGGFYDYIANLTNGSQQALQALIKKKFGLVGKYEMRDADVLLLKVDHPNAPGLKPGTPSQPEIGFFPISNGKIHYKNYPISKLCRDLEWNLQVPVIDQTELTGNYDLDCPDYFAIPPSERIEKIKQVLPEELGLKLVPTNLPIEMLVVEKAR